ncbi:MAG: ATP-binding protein [Oligoflexus sp.]
MASTIPDASNQEESLPFHNTMHDSPELDDYQLRPVRYGAFSFHPEHDRLYLTKDSASILGFSLGQLAISNDDWFHLIHPVDQIYWLETLDELIQMGGERSCRIRIQPSQGGTKEIFCRLELMKNDMIDSPYIMGTLCDGQQLVESQEFIRKTIRKAEERAENAEKRQRILDTLMDQIPIGIVIAEAPSGQITNISKWGYDIMGYSLDDVKDIPLEQQPVELSVFYADGQTIVDVDDFPLARSICHGELITGEELVVENIHGEKIPILCTSGPIRDSNGRIIGGIAAWQDLREQKRTAHKLRSLNEELQKKVKQLQAIFEVLPAAICVSDQNLENVIANRQAYEIVDLPLDQKMDIKKFLNHTTQNRFRFLRDGHDMQCDELPMIYAAKHQVEVSNAEFDLLIDQKKMRSFYANAKPIFNEQGCVESVVGVFMDITRLKVMEREQQKITQRLRRADRKKDEFLAMLSHELRNPLATMQNALELMSRSELGGEKRCQAEEILQDKVKLLSRIVDELLDVSRISHGHIDLRLEKLELGSLIKKLLPSISPHVEKAKQQLHINLPPETIWVHGDAVRLEQVLINILNNAHKYTPGGGQISLCAYVEDEHIKIAIKDTGVGISPAMMPKIFELFAQESQSLDRNQGGLGVGLTLAAKLVDLHGGNLTAFSSGQNQGSEFLITLPRLRNCETCEYAPSKTPADQQSADPCLVRVLVVDDNIEAAVLIQDILRLEGHSVISVHDGRAAIRAAFDFKPQVILLDIGLPGIDGFEVARELRRHECFQSTRLIAVTGYGFAEDFRKSKEAGIDFHLLKPVNFDNLLELVTDLKNESTCGEIT